MAPAKILVVDDEIDLQRLIQQRFRKHIQSEEMDFIFASSGVEALCKLRHDQHIDMVLTDINMPDMDGLTLIHFLPKVSETLKAVVISAYGDMARVRRAMNEGAFDFLTKPIDFQDLESTIRKTLKCVRRLQDQQRQLQRQQAELRHVAFHDGLTGLPNRVWLNQYLHHQFKQHSTSSQSSLANPLTALLFVDLDGFKQINDRFGHSIGDHLLQQVAQRLNQCLRTGDAAVRLGGDEFVLVLGQVTDLAGAIAVAERVRQQFAQPFTLNGVEGTIGASIGIALSDTLHQNPEEFLREADLAMYAAKSQGKGCYQIAPQAIANQT
jgi:diguanylate cyclase (GGDEF)-like protein